MKNRVRLGLLLAPLAFTCAVHAQDAYPSKPIRMIVPFGAGGPTDLIARLAAEGMSKRLGQPVVVENRPGAAGRIGLEAIATQPADGYNIGFVAGTLNSLSAFSKDWKRDVVTTYTYIGSMVESNTVLWAPANAPGKDLAEYLAYYKANPGKINIAFTAPGPHELPVIHLNEKWGLKATRINYKGTAEARAALIAGDVHLLLDGLAAPFPDYKAGKLKPLAVLGPRRLPELPDVPTLRETKTADYNIDTSALFGVIAPAGLPEPVTAKLTQALADAMKDEATLNRIRNIGGFIIQYRPGSDFRAITKSQTELVNRLAKEYHIEPQ